MSNSIGDLRNSGLQGNNFPWQLKMLKGLQALIDSGCCDEILALLAPQARKAIVDRVTGSWTNNDDTYSFSVANVGSANGIVNGATIKPGEIVNFDAGVLNNYFKANSIVVNGTGTELLVSWIVLG
jgi:hypothetical protein